MEKGEKMEGNKTKWVCPICGYVHNGDTPPETCPLCGIPRDKFIKEEA
jgi:rubrerythrin